jgi:hypothetical protein
MPLPDRPTTAVCTVILNMKVFLLAAAGSGNLANEHSLDLLIS